MPEFDFRALMNSDEKYEKGVGGVGPFSLAPSLNPLNVSYQSVIEK